MIIIVAYCPLPWTLFGCHGYCLFTALQEEYTGKGLGNTVPQADYVMSMQQPHALYITAVSSFQLYVYNYSTTCTAVLSETLDLQLCED
jgi:hypothetical protein